MERITQQEFDRIPSDYKGMFINYDGQHPEWKGRRTAFLPGHGTTLFIEGVSFEIVGGNEKGITMGEKYAKYSGDVLVQTARLRFLVSGHYAFETSLFGKKPYEVNMNMPLFDSEPDAVNWIRSTGKWSVTA